MCTYHAEHQKLQQQAYCWKINEVLDEEYLHVSQIKESEAPHSVRRYKQ